ncbi:hypothetical protein EIP91_002638 [Steccherinum ochraceum]|uniref:Major facilitator superfamily (MFS) profile domain-containing protein n=1 Tax=Steccherinum ochraceum TaxID=92696 RepID=A0A4R0S0P6_9APHY|nr:hypothetical protein EIP91_002638 [Steccherinum ochraceum]
MTRPHEGPIPAGDSPAMPGTKKDLKFWLILLSLCLCMFVSALDFTGLSTALPVISNDLRGGDFAWVGTAYAISATAVLPLTGGFAEIFGRRATMVITLLLFLLGSALCGAAQHMNWLIAARVVQGLGGGGLLSVPSIIVSDLVALHERGAYQSMFGLTWAFASAIAPLVAGALAQHGQWRWFFYMNLPISGAALVAVLVFVTLPTPPGTFMEKLLRIDWIGNLIIVGSTTSLIIGLTWGGVNFAWGSAQVLVPLILGILGLVAFIVYEGLVPKHPLVPWTILHNLTSLSGFLQTFFHPVVTVAVMYYLPAYYQACKDASPIRSAVLMLSMALVTSPTTIIGSVSVNVTQKYRPQLWIAWVIYVAGIGSLISIHADSSLALSVGLTVLVAFGSGIIYTGVYYPVLAPLPVSQNAAAISFLSFLRTFAGVWGIAIGATILQNELSRRLPDAFLAEIAAGNTGSASSSAQLAYSIIPIIRTLPEPLKHEVRVAFADGVSRIWIVMTALGAAGLASSFLMRDVPMQKIVDPKWVLENKAASTSDESVRVDAPAALPKEVA